MFASRFESEEKSFKNRKTSVAAFVTIALHALIVLLLLWAILTPPDPPYTDSAGGVAVNFGTDDAGTGDVQQTTLTPIQADFTPPAASGAAQPASSNEEVVTQDIEDAPEMAKSKTETPKPKNTVPSTRPNTTTNTNTSNKPRNENPAPTQPVVDDKALFHKGMGGNPNNSKSDGTGGGNGDQGNPNGDNSRNYQQGEGGHGSGPGRGGLNGVSLKGRRSTSLPAPKFCSEKGNVIIDITVNKNGDVTDAKYHRDGSTITDRCSIDNAIIAAKRSKFNPDPNADELQYGSINYVFTVQ
jgi:outer membrane biosynthesis protein TonB